MKGYALTALRAYPICGGHECRVRSRTARRLIRLSDRRPFTAFHLLQELLRMSWQLFCFS